MSLLQGCSELEETARLVEELLGCRPVAPAASGPTLVYSRAAAPKPAEMPADAGTVQRGQEPVEPSVSRESHDSHHCHASHDSQITGASPVAPPPPEPMPTFAYRGDRLEYILSSMCRRGELTGAVVADGKGLPLADFNSPVAGEILAAFTSVLGSALERAGMLLGESGADLISMDINYTDKVVLRRFIVGEAPYFLMAICQQELDERTELELSIEQLIAALSE